MFGPTISDYYRQAERSSEQEIKTLKLDLDTADKLALEQGLFTKYALTSVELREDLVTRSNTNEAGNFLKIYLPFTDNPSILENFRWQSSRFSLSGPPQYKLEVEKGRFVLDLQFASPDSVQAAWAGRLKTFREFLEWRNQDIDDGNIRLRSHISRCIAERIDFLEEARKRRDLVADSLNIPVSIVESAKPVNVAVRQQVQDVRASTGNGQKSGPVMENSVAQEIIATASQLGRQFEIAPKVYSKLGEEDLRHVLLAILNAVFKLDGKAEAFNRKGKTDMLFMNVPDGQGFIVECKFWGGPENFLETIDQLFGYLDWRKSFAVLVIFSKNKSVTGVIDAAKSSLKKREILGEVQTKAVGHLVSQHTHPRDSARSIEVHTLIFDLAVSD